jgi:hypothetical protein
MATLGNCRRRVRTKNARLSLDEARGIADPARGGRTPRPQAFEQLRATPGNTPRSLGMRGFSKRRGLARLVIAQRLLGQRIQRAS